MDSDLKVCSLGAVESVALGKGHERMFEEPVFERGTLALEGRRRLEVPASAVVLVADESENVRFWLEKSLGFMGHPPGPMSMQLGRKYMGLATRGDSLATFGEFSTFEGGATLKLVLEIPSQVEVVRRPDLAGQASAAAGPCLPEPDCYWYHSTRPAEGWQALDTLADPDGRAASAVTPQEELRRQLAETPAARAVGERLFELKTLLDGAASFQRGVDARLLQCFDEIQAEIQPLHAELHAVGQKAREGLAQNDCAAAYEWFEQATSIFPWNLESQAGAQYLEETARSMQDVAAQLMARLESRLAESPANPMSQRLGMMMKLMKWQGRSAVRLTGPVEKGSPSRGDRWLVNMDLEAMGVKVTFSGATSGSVGRLEVTAEPEGNQLEDGRELSLRQLTLEVTESGRASGRFAFDVPATGKTASGTFANFPVMTFRGMDLVGIPDGEPDDPPQPTVELTWT